MWRVLPSSEGSRSQDHASCPRARKALRTMPEYSQATRTLMPGRRGWNRSLSYLVIHGALRACLCMTGACVPDLLCRGSNRREACRTWRARAGQGLVIHRRRSGYGSRHCRRGVVWSWSPPALQERGDRAAMITGAAECRAVVEPFGGLIVGFVGISAVAHKPDADVCQYVNSLIIAA